MVQLLNVPQGVHHVLLLGPPDRVLYTHQTVAPTVLFPAPQEHTLRVGIHVAVVVNDYVVVVPLNFDFIEEMMGCASIVNCRKRKIIFYFHLI